MIPCPHEKVPCPWRKKFPAPITPENRKWARTTPELMHKLAQATVALTRKLKNSLPNSLPAGKSRIMPDPICRIKKVWQAGIPGLPRCCKIPPDLAGVS